jgi:hypothetical protein
MEQAKHQYLNKELTISLHPIFVKLLNCYNLDMDMINIKNVTVIFIAVSSCLTLVEHKKGTETKNVHYFHSVWNESFVHPSQATFTQQVFLAERVGGISQLTECKHPARDVIVANP